MTTEMVTTTKECTCHKFIRLHDGNCAMHGFVRRRQPGHEQPASAEADDYECDACGKYVPKDELRGGIPSAGVEGLFCHKCRHGKGCDCMESASCSAARAGAEWRAIKRAANMIDIVDDEGVIANVSRWRSGVAGTEQEADQLAGQVLSSHNQHQHCATQLQFLANRAEELSSLLAGMTTERDGLREALLQARAFVSEATWESRGARSRKAEWLVKEINAALNHAEQTG